MIEHPPVQVPLCRPTLGTEEEESIVEVLRSGYLVAGRWVTEFENRLSRQLKGVPVSCVSNGTAALHLSMVALELQPGDEVLVPAMTYPAPVNVVHLMGATPVLVDIDGETGGMNPDKLDAAWTPRTKGIIPVHQFGIPVNMAAIMDFARERGLWVVEDAACALGAKTNQGLCGTVGDLGCFSFHPRKVLTTGEGGAIAINRPEFVKRIAALRNHGQDLGAPFEHRFSSAGFNVRMSDLQGAIGVCQMDRFPDFVESRAKWAAQIREGIESVGGLKFLPGHFREGSVVQSLVGILDAGIDREAFCNELRGLGVENTIASYGIHRLPLWRDRHNPADFPNAEQWHQRGVTLPLFPHMTSTQVTMVIESVNRVVKGGKK